MKLLYWTPRFWPDIGGIQTLSKIALPELAKRGYEITVLTSHNEGQPPEVTDFNGIPVHRYAFWTALQENDVFQIARINQSIHKSILKLQPDLIHYDFSGYTVLYLQSLLKRHPLPYLTAVHGKLPADLCQPGSTISRLFEKADWVTTISQNVMKDVQSLIPPIREKSTTIHGFADFATSKALPLPAGKPLILGIGRLEHEKGFDVLISAAKRLADSDFDFDIKLLGEGSQRQVLQEQVLELGLENHVQFMGQINHADLTEWIAQAKLVVIPTRGHEAFGIAAAEAGLLGRPVIASRLGGLPEVIEDGKTGLLVPEENPAALAETIKQLLNDPERVERMGQSAHKRIQAQFTLSRYVEAFDKLYQQIVSANVAP
jgi:glycosyltransferase involved in cell wall biosynthesis